MATSTASSAVYGVESIDTWEQNLYKLHSMNTIQFGVHYMLDGYGANPDILSNKVLLLEILTQLPGDLQMHPISEPLVVEVGEMNTKDPGGLSGFVMIAESHISFHTFPSRGFVTIDVYTCQNDLDTATLTKKFTELFQLSEVDEFVKPRGIKYPTENMHLAT